MARVRLSSSSLGSTLPAVSTSKTDFADAAKTASCATGSYFEYTSVAATALLCASITWSVAGHLAQSTQPRGETLATQRADVAPIREWVDQTGTEWIAAHPWGAAVAPIVLSGAHVGLWDAPAMADVPRLTGAQCDTEVLVEGGRYRVCAAPAG